MNNFESLTHEQKELIEKHLDLVIEANKVVNLTRITNIDEAMLLHIEDSLLALPEVNNAPKGTLGDLGSGGGYPGIPLSIASGRKTVLVDSRLKKVQALDGIINELGLEHQIKTYAGRAELLARKQHDCFAVLCARALAKLSVLMELASPLLQRNGHLICYKANVEENELDHALKVQNITGMRRISDRVELLGDDITRRIIVFEKYKDPEISLPRQEGQAQRDPL